MLEETDNVARNKSLYRGNLELQEKPESFDVVAVVLKNMRSRSDTFIEDDRASYSRGTLVASTCVVRNY